MFSINISDSYVSNDPKIGVNAALDYLKQNGWMEVKPSGHSGVLRDNSDKNRDYYGLLTIPQKFNVSVS